MISTTPQTHHSSVRRPALFLSPTSSNIGHARQSSSPSLPGRFHSAEPRPSVPEVRLAVLGALGVGKSALVVRYITKRFIMEYDPYLEDIYSKTDTFESRTVVVKIMDTSESADKKPERYLKWANAFIVVYSIVCRESFDDARKYLDVVSKYQRISGNDGPVALVGNKADLERYRTVSRSEGEALAARLDCAYFETSAAEDLSSVTTAFGRVLSDVLRLHDRQPTLQALYISEDRAAAGRIVPSSSRLTSSAVTSSSDSSSAPSKDEKLQAATPSRRNFKLFNKGFRIFN